MVFALGKIKLNRTVEISIGVALFVVVVYLGSVTLKVTSGVSKTIESPKYQVRLQILNGCGVRGAAGMIGDRLGNYRDDEIELMVVDTDNFDLTEIPESFVIARTENAREAIILADKLGLNNDNIEYRPLDNNFRHVSVTLVLGSDYERISFASGEKEGESSN